MPMRPSSARGWIVDVHTGDELPPQFYNQHARMHLQCVCRDPDVQPLSAEPLRFSIPEGRHSLRNWPSCSQQVGQGPPYDMKDGAVGRLKPA